MRNALAIFLTLAATACAEGPPSKAALKQQATEARRLDEALAGLIPGKPISCIESRLANGPESYGETTLLFRMGSKLIYRTETRGTCRDVGNGRALVTRTFGSRLCRGDIASVADLTAGFSTDTCVMGDFVPYRKAKS
jgi:hypothetical protein